MNGDGMDPCAGEQAAWPRVLLGVSQSSVWDRLSRDPMLLTVAANARQADGHVRG
jgi:hypothetical protein